MIPGRPTPLSRQSLGAQPGNLGPCKSKVIHAFVKARLFMPLSKQSFWAQRGNLRLVKAIFIWGHSRLIYVFRQFNLHFYLGNVLGRNKVIYIFVKGIFSAQQEYAFVKKIFYAQRCCFFLCQGSI